MNPHVLIVDDDPGILKVISAFIRDKEYKVSTAPYLAEAKRVMSDEMIDAVLLDYNLPDGTSLDWIPKLRSKYPALAIIMITGEGDISIAVKAMQFGADHFIEKPVHLQDLEVSLNRSLEVRNLKRKSIHAKRLKKSIPIYWGDSDVMKTVRKHANVAAASETPVLLTGETGTGKGMLANWIHEQSKRNPGEFVEINCTSLRGELLISELFGHKKGAFTSAIEDKPGLIEIAHGGTLFLDEIGDMGPEIQAQFLKVLEEKHYRRLGETKVIKSDFRLICATNRDLQNEIEAARFRHDLYYRINVFPVSLPPLKHRTRDIVELAEFILVQLGAQEVEISKSAQKALMNYYWPGNIREMRNILERALLLAEEAVLLPEHLIGLSAQKRPDPAGSLTLETVESDHIRKILGQCGHDTQIAAEILGISRASLYRKIGKYKIK